MLLVCAFAKLRKAIVIFMSVRLSPWNNTTPIGRIVIKFWYLSIFRKSVEKIKVPLELNKNNGYFTWRPIYVILVSRSVLRTMKSISDKSCIENQKTNLLFDFFYRKIMLFVRCLEKCCGVGQATIWQYGSWAFHAGYPRLQTHTQNMWYFLLYHGKNGCTNAPQYYVIRTSCVLLWM
jgi:hypothetical protein